MFNSGCWLQLVPATWISQQQSCHASCSVVLFFSCPVDIFFPEESSSSPFWELQGHFFLDGAFFVCCGLCAPWWRPVLVHLQTSLLRGTFFGESVVWMSLVLLHVFDFFFYLSAGSCGHPPQTCFDSVLCFRLERASVSKVDARVVPVMLCLLSLWSRWRHLWVVH